MIHRVLPFFLSTYSIADQNTCPVPRVAPDRSASSWVDSKGHSRVAIKAVDGVLNCIGVAVAEVWGTLDPRQSTGCELKVGGGQGCSKDSSGEES